jgi:hypothetical protein
VIGPGRSPALAVELTPHLKGGLVALPRARPRRQRLAVASCGGSDGIEARFHYLTEADIQACLSYAADRERHMLVAEA